jgi:hypothetical protein
MPIPVIPYLPEPLTHVEQELYTRPHAGTGLGSPDITSSVAKLRQDTDLERRRAITRKLLGGRQSKKEGVSMPVQPPRHKDMDPNSPENLSKMKPKREEGEYIPYALPEGISYETG